MMANRSEAWKQTTPVTWPFCCLHDNANDIGLLT